MTSSHYKEKSQNLQKLQALCDKLGSKDVQLERDIQMFESFFTNFPVPVTIWSIGNDHAVLSKRGNSFMQNEAKTLEEIFDCPILKKQSVQKHEIALQGETVTYFMHHENQLLWCKLIPRRDDTGAMLGVMGIAWDVSSNALMLHGLERALELLDNGGGMDEIRDEITKALDSSRLRRMLAEEEMTHV